MKTMQNILKSFFVLVCVCLLCSCGHHHPGGVDFYIDNANGRSLSLYEVIPGKGNVFVQTIEIDKKGNAQFVMPGDTMRLYALVADKNQPEVYIIPNPHRYLRLDADYNDFFNSIRASFVIDTAHTCPTADLIAYQHLVAQTDKKIHAIEQEWEAQRYQAKNADALHDSCIAKVKALRDSIKQVATELCRVHRTDLLPIYVINKNVGGQSLFSIEDYYDLKILQQCVKELDENIPGNAHIKRLLENMQRVESAVKQKELQRLEEEAAKEEAINKARRKKRGWN